jgi:23S rRNA-/tRNA-specific pseudouridylate synthase
LRKFLPSAPLSGIYKLARTGKIKINGKRVDNEYRVEA